MTIASRVDITINAAIVWLLASTVTAILLISWRLFDPFASMGFGVVVLVVCWKTGLLNLPHRKVPPRALALLGLILVVALVLRLDPSRYVLGAQDQGTYVLLSQQYLREGGNFHIDRLRESIDDPELLAYYDTYNQRHVGMESMPWFEKGKYEGAHYMGLYVSNLEKSEYVFQFYPVQSIWLALFSRVFGAQNGVWCTVFFGVVSIVLGFFLVFEISGSSGAALTTAGLFTVNALHVFFSRFPVSEIAALCFFLTFLLYLARYVNHRSSVALLFSGVAILCYFFTRISGFVLLPFVLSGLAIGMIYLSRERWARTFTIYCLAVLAAYGLSLWYGYVQSYPYFRDIFVNSVGRALGDHWLAKIAYGAISIFLVLVLFRVFAARLRPLVDGILVYKSLILGALLACVTLLAIYRVYVFSYTDQYVDILSGINWKRMGFGWPRMQFSTIYVFCLVVTPPGIVLLLWGIGKAMRRNTVFDASLILLFLSFWTYISVVMMTTPYLYYYGRYQISELIPLALILIGLGIASSRQGVQSA